MESSTKAVKFDEGKVRMDLIPVRPLRGIADVLTQGALKYGDRNWEKGLDFSRIYAAALRHLTAWWDGEDKDPEDGLLHLDHAAANMMFLSEFVKRQIGTDDRPKY